MSIDKAKSAEKTSYSDPLKELLSESLEIIADKQIQEGILKDIPVAGWLLKTHKIFTSIKDQIFFRKLSRFLSECETISVENKVKFWAKYEGDEAEKQKLGEQLIIYLDRYDTVDKASLLARAFGAYVNSQIFREDFLDLSALIDSLQLHHLRDIVSILIITGDNVYTEINVSSDLKRFAQGMEAQRLLEYKDESKIVKHMGAKIETVRKHRCTPLAKNFLNFVIHELYVSIATELEKLDSIYYERGEKT